MLKYYRFSIKSLDSPISLPTSTSEQLTTIEYLVIDHPCTFNEFATIISYALKFSRLYFMDINENNSNIGIRLPITLSNLTHIAIKVYYLTFDVSKTIPSPTPSQLTVIEYFYLRNM
jgi:hypothetical protein